MSTSNISFSNQRRKQLSHLVCCPNFNHPHPSTSALGNDQIADLALSMDSSPLWQAFLRDSWYQITGQVLEAGDDPPETFLLFAAKVFLFGQTGAVRTLPIFAAKEC